MTLFSKRHYLIFTKPAGPAGKIAGHVPTVATQVMYRKKVRWTIYGDITEVLKFWKRKFYLTHQLHTDYLMWWWQAKLWMFLFRILGQRRNKLFAYKFPNGTVFMKKYY